MHNLKNNYLLVANIKIVVWLYVVVGVIVFLIFPIFLKLEFFYDKDKLKVYFAFKLYGFLKIFGGYIEIIKEGLAVHVSKSKAIIIPIQIFEIKNQFSLSKDYKIVSIYILSEIGVTGENVLPFFLVGMENVFFKIFFPVFSTLKTGVKLKNDILVYENENLLKISAQINVAFNVIILIITFIKILLRKILNERKKQNKYSY